MLVSYATSDSSSRQSRQAIFFGFFGRSEVDIFSKTEEFFRAKIAGGEKEILVDTAVLRPKPDINKIKQERLRNQMPKQKTKSSSPARPAPKGDTVDAGWKNADSLEKLYECIKDCKECPLGEKRTNFVFGEGNPDADIMIIGEAPGRDEDKHGRPFIGRAGQLLTKILEAIDIKREDVFIGNICKCRPPDNRRPAKHEVDVCEPYLLKQIELINPMFIVSLGLTSIETLMKKSFKMGDIRGEIMEFHGRKLMVTYHPAALLRNPNWKRPVWEDMKKLKQLYAEEKAKQ